MIFLLVTAIAIFCDQIIKLFVNYRVALYDPQTVIPGILSIYHVQNKGMSFSFLENQPWARYVLAAVSVIGAVIILLFMIRLRGNRLAAFGLSLMLGGTVGNGIDRIRVGYVTDMIQLDFLKVGSFQFPVFNFADMLLTAGVIIVVVYILISGRSKAKDMPLTDDIEFYDEASGRADEPGYAGYGEETARETRRSRRNYSDTAPLPDGGRILTQEEQFELAGEKKRRDTAELFEVQEAAREKKPLFGRGRRAARETPAEEEPEDDRPIEFGSFRVSRPAAAPAEPEEAPDEEAYEPDVKQYTPAPRREDREEGKAARRAARYDTPYEVDNYRRAEAPAEGYAAPARPRTVQEAPPARREPRAETPLHAPVRSQPRPQEAAALRRRPPEDAAPRAAAERPIERPAERPRRPAPENGDIYSEFAPVQPRREAAPAAPRQRPAAPSQASAARPAAERPARPAAAAARPAERREGYAPRPAASAPAQTPRYSAPAQSAPYGEPTIDDILAELESSGLPDSYDTAALDDLLD
ncbi:MAG: signal peptidase II [Oscillospiraceae bacterium]|jgi:signal peptidase II|nr:signal peptidase II [Oscillospiraceae bacterium]